MNGQANLVQPIFISAKIFAPVMMQQGHGIFINITRYVSEGSLQRGMLTHAARDVLVLAPDLPFTTLPKQL